MVQSAPIRAMFISVFPSPSMRTKSATARPGCFHTFPMPFHFHPLKYSPYRKVSKKYPYSPAPIHRGLPSRQIITDSLSMPKDFSTQTITKARMPAENPTLNRL